MAKKRNTQPPRGRRAEVSTINSSQIKSGIGKTGVSLRYYKWDEFKTLNPEQKDELDKWRESSGRYADKKTSKRPHSAKSPKSSDTDKRIKRMIYSAISKDCSKTVDNTTKVVTAASTQDVQDGAYLLNALKSHISATTV